MQKITDLGMRVPFSKQCKVLLSLGSNIEPKNDYLKKAKVLIEAKNIGRIIKESIILENSPILYENQNDFLNQIIEIKTTLDPYRLLKELKKLEKEIGRQKTFRYGPREIDIDILFYQNHTIQSYDLTIPHPGVFNRNYLKILLQEFDIRDYE